MRAWGTRWVWPVFVLGSLAAYASVLAAGGGPIGFFLVSAGIVTALIGLEPLLPARRQPGALRDPEVWNDIGHSLVGQGGSTWLGESLLLVAVAGLAGQLGERSGTGLWPTSWPYAVQALLLVAIADGAEYARHRLLHTVPWLWPIHALHHGVDRMHVLKSGRTHILDMLMRYAFVFSPLVALGVPADVILWYPVAVTILGPIGHSNVDVRIPSFVHRIVLTPQEHRIHHARPLELSCSNYANVFPFWDILFGTFEHPDAHAEPEIGIDAEIPRSFGAQLALPFTFGRVAPAPGRPLRGRAARPSTARV